MSTVQRAIYEICTCFPKEITEIIAEYDAPTVPHRVGQYCTVLSDGRVLSASYQNCDIYDANMTKISQTFNLYHITYVCEISASQLLCNSNGSILIVDISNGEIHWLDSLGKHNVKVVQLDNKDLFVITRHKNYGIFEVFVYDIKVNILRECPATYNVCAQQLTPYNDGPRDYYASQEWLNITRCLMDDMPSLGEHKIILKTGGRRREYEYLDNGVRLRDNKKLRLTDDGFKITDGRGTLAQEQKTQPWINTIVELDNSQLFCISNVACIYDAKGSLLFESPYECIVASSITSFPGRKLLTELHLGGNVLWL